MKTTKADGFEITRTDNRPNGQKQQYPYSQIRTFRGNAVLVEIGEKVRKGTAFSQPAPATQTMFHVEAGDTVAKAKPGFICLDGEVSFEDFKRWREDGLNVSGHTIDLTGREEYLRVIAAQVQKL